MRREFIDAGALWSVGRVLLLVLIAFSGGMFVQSQFGDFVDSYFRGTPLRFESLPWPTRDAQGKPASQFRAGDSVLVMADFTVIYPGTLQTELLLVSDNAERDRRLPGTQTPILPGRYELNARASTLPVDTVPGRYRIRGTSLLDGKLRDYTASWETEEFEVVP